MELNCDLISDFEDKQVFTYEVHLLESGLILIHSFLVLHQNSCSIIYQDIATTILYFTLTVLTKICGHLMAACDRYNYELKGY